MNQPTTSTETMNHCLECGRAFHRDYDSQYTARANGFCGIECRSDYVNGSRYFEIVLTATRLPFNQTCSGCDKNIKRRSFCYVREGHHAAYHQGCAANIPERNLTLGAFKPYEQCR